ncbi:MAG TPA: radical SAM family heme chaperone HemW [Candidatus Cloacimonetes bacterium]|nr:radical SAM family heme chaperone HemW [Candidatus Cloacimonadota bacterium]
MEQDFQARALGLYLHIPFCLSRCPYCNFFSKAYNRQAFSRYFELLLQQKELSREYISRPLDSVYFGGGTPSLLSAEQINSFLEDLPLAADCEITLEINPIMITESFVQELKKTPINRLSLGVQSMIDKELSYLGRKHKAKDIPPKIELLKNHGYHNLSADLIYGIPSSSIKDVEASLQELTELPIQHISTYLLEIEPESPLAKDISFIPEDETLEEMYHLIREQHETHGFRQYEISNFARAGKESRHNLIYWQGGDYLGFGASAWGYVGGRRYYFPADLTQYEELIARGEALGIEDKEACAKADFIMMNLRLIQGLDLEEYQARFGEDILEVKAREIKSLKAQDLIFLEGKTLKINPDALFISNAVISELI